MEELKTLVDNYGKINTEFNTLKKEVETKKSELKTLMTGKSDEALGNEYKVTCKKIASEKFNDDKLVIKLHEMWTKEHGSVPCPWTVQVYVPNMKEIEDAIYSGEINPKDLAECKEVSYQTRLTVSKIKK